MLGQRHDHHDSPRAQGHYRGSSLPPQAREAAKMPVTQPWAPQWQQLYRCPSPLWVFPFLSGPQLDTSVPKIEALATAENICRQSRTAWVQVHHGGKQVPAPRSHSGRPIAPGPGREVVQRPGSGNHRPTWEISSCRSSTLWLSGSLTREDREVREGDVPSPGPELPGRQHRPILRQAPPTGVCTGNQAWH